MPHLGFFENSYGVKISSHKCDSCGEVFTVCPPVQIGQDGWNGCMSEGCDSYDPSRDADLLFMSDTEIITDKKVVSLEMLQSRKRGVLVGKND
jgi:hypothetical protein